RLTRSDSAESLLTGWITSFHNIRFSVRPISRNTALNRPTTTHNAWSARLSGTDIGTDTTCAPIGSVMFQPKPLFGPYLSISVCGAAATVLWQRRQAGLLILIGRATNSD